MTVYVAHKLKPSSSDKPRLIDAPNQAAVYRHYARTEISVRVASQQDLVSLLSTDKIVVERVTADADAS